MLMIATAPVDCVGLYDFFNGDTMSALVCFAIGGGGMDLSMSHAPGHAKMIS